MLISLIGGAVPAAGAVPAIARPVLPPEAGSDGGPVGMVQYKSLRCQTVVGFVRIFIVVKMLFLISQSKNC